MNYDELKQQYGDATKAAQAVANETHPIGDGEDFMAWPEWFRSLILFFRARR